MLQPYKIDLYVYAENAEQALALQEQLKAFVNEKRQQGIAVQATTLSKAIQRFKNNPLLFQFLKYGNS